MKLVSRAIGCRFRPGLRAACRVLSLLAFGLSLLRLAHADPVVWETMPDTWAAVDDLGRNVAENASAGGWRTNRTLGVFYYIWQGSHGINTDNQGRIFDNTQVLAENASLKAAPWDSTRWAALNSSAGGFHYWAQPLFGYYNYLSDVNHIPDEWVIRKHCQMLTDAGVDVIVIDVTNGYTYDGTWQKIMNVYAAIRAAGGKTPQVMFITYSNSGTTAQHLYDVLYSVNFHPKLWFQWQGKPMILGQTAQFSTTLLNFFTVRNCWAFPGAPQNNWWWWTDLYPQDKGVDINGVFEEMPMAVFDSPYQNHGRGWTSTGGNPAWPGPYTNSGKGLYLAEQFGRVQQADPSFLFVTQWNEWVAQRLQNSASGGPGTFLGHAQASGDTYFVDEFDIEYSRDLEPVKGFYGDNYYWQFVDEARKFKGARAAPAASAPVMINLNSFSAWTNVAPQYLDDLGDVFHRNSTSVLGKVVYIDNTGRNDFRQARVARDATNLYFFVETVSNLTARVGTNWMNLFIGIETSPAANWQKFQYLVCPSNNTANAPLMLKAYIGNGTNWSWSAGNTVTVAVSNTQMALAIPRTALGLTPGQTSANLRFKWADNMQTGNPLDWLQYGDTAPNARFAYRYRAEFATNLVAWFKADALIGLTNNAPVATWIDSSGSGNDATQTGVALCPAFVTNAINGCPAVRFNAASSNSLAFNRVVQDDFTILCVFRSTQGIGTGTAFYQGAGLVNGEVGGTTTDLGTSLNATGQVLAGTGNPDVTVASAAGFNNNQPHLFTFERTRLGGALALYVDGGTATTGTGGTNSLAAPPRLVLGAQQTGVNFFNGDIAEVKIFNQVLDAADRQVEESALRYKYGVGNPPAPAIAITRTNASLLFTWPASAASFALWSATNLTLAWTPVDNPKIIANGQVLVQVNPTASCSYFRLVGP